MKEEILFLSGNYGVGKYNNLNETFTRRAQ